MEQDDDDSIRGRIGDVLDAISSDAIRGRDDDVDPDVRGPSRRL